MAISVGGIGSGLDINGIVSQLMTLERRPLTLLSNKEASYQAKLSAFGQVKGSLVDLQTAANALKDTTKFTATKTTTGADAAFTASSTSKASAGSYSVEVSQLAKTQRVSTDASTAFTPAAGGLKVTFGTVDDSGGNFVADPERTATLEFAGGTIEELRDAINANAALGIKASVINNGEGKQLVLSGTATGADKAFQLEGVEVDGNNGLAGLAYVPGAASGDMSTVQKAQSAKLSIDGIAITRSNNSITDAIEGVTLTLTKESATPVASSLNVASDRGAAKSAIDAFVKSYNEAVGTLKNLTAYDAENKKGSLLTGDSTARNIQNQLRSLVGSSYSGMSETSSLASIGISLEKDGTLSVNSTKLDAALNDPKRDVAAFFAGKEGVKGFAAIVSDTLENISGKSGLLASRSDGIKASIQTIEKQYESLSVRLDAVEKRYMDQFTALDSLVASLTQTQTFLTQQLASLPS